MTVQDATGSVGALGTLAGAAIARFGEQELVTILGFVILIIGFYVCVAVWGVPPQSQHRPREWQGRWED